MNVIDAHVHLYPSQINTDPAGWAAGAGESAWAGMSVRSRKNGTPVQAFPSEQVLLEAMDRAGIERAVLAGWYWETPEACALQNSFYAGLVKQHPDRLSALATVQLKGDWQRAVDQVRRTVDLGFVGLGELCPQAQGYPILGEAMEAVIAASSGQPLLFHADDPTGRAYPGKVPTPHRDFLELAQRHPKHPFILAHWGGQGPLLEATPVPSNLFFDTAASPLLYDAGIWTRFLDRVPASQVLFGSDTPLTLYSGAGLDSAGRLIQEAKASGLSEAQLSAILAENARTLFC